MPIPLTDTDLRNASELLGVSPSTLKPFREYDPWNHNSLEGYICSQNDKHYGALVIIQINDTPVVPQVIYGMPKIQYPFAKTDTGERNYHHSMEDVVAIIKAEKWDGTNICAYTYWDGEKQCVAYKTRLTAILRGDSTYGNFRAMWDEVNPITAHGNPYSELLKMGFHVCFELCGFRNPHTVKYPFALEAKYLVAIRKDGVPIIPEGDYVVMDFISEYEKAREDAEKINTNEDEVIYTEGSVFYLIRGNGFATPFKCKPESVEKLHWMSSTIEPGAVYTTVVNALENMDYTELTVENVLPLFQEEYTEEQISRSMIRIEKAIAQVVGHIEWVQRVRRAADSLVGNTEQPIDKGILMKYMSDFFARTEMRQVYSALREIGYLE